MAIGGRIGAARETRTERTTAPPRYARRVPVPTFSSGPEPFLIGMVWCPTGGGPGCAACLTKGFGVVFVLLSIEFDVIPSHDSIQPTVWHKRKQTTRS